MYLFYSYKLSLHFGFIELFESVKGYLFLLELFVIFGLMDSDQPIILQ
jgi:hypothetical protein